VFSHISTQDVLSFVSLWERLWMQSPTTFPGLLRHLLLQHYPSDHKTTLDVVLPAFISFHPQYASNILDGTWETATTSALTRQC
jgi:hypothetical protein